MDRLRSRNASGSGRARVFSQHMPSLHGTSHSMITIAAGRGIKRRRSPPVSATKITRIKNAVYRGKAPSRMQRARLSLLLANLSRRLTNLSRSLAIGRAVLYFARPSGLPLSVSIREDTRDARSHASRADATRALRDQALLPALANLEPSGCRGLLR